jgi:hypothetical protein
MLDVHATTVRRYLRKDGLTLQTEHGKRLGLELTAYCFFGVTSIKGIAPPVTLGILPFHF